MSAKFFATLLSALTLTLGHVSRGRSDRALLFFVLLLTWMLSSTFVGSIGAIDNSASNPDDMLKALYQRYFNVAAGTVALFIASALVTWFGRAGLDRPGPVAWVGGLIAGMASLAITALTIYSAASIPTSVEVGLANNESAENRAFDIPRVHVWDRAYLGRPGGNRIERTLTPPDEGHGRFDIAFSYHGKPAVGIETRVGFRNGTKTPAVVSDSNGIARFNLSPGAYRVVWVEISAWENAPRDTKVFLDSGVAPSLGEGTYREHDAFMDREGELVEVTETPPRQPQLALTLRDKLVLDWPPRGGAPVQATLTQDAIAWEPVPDAATYQVQISKVTRSGRSTTYFPVNWRNTPTNRLPLTELPVTRSSDQDAEYSVEVFAFDDTGRRISETGHMGTDATFRITGPVQLLDQQRFPDLSDDDLGAEEIAKQIHAQRQLDAVGVLIDAGMFDAAEELLDGITQPRLSSKVKCIRGRLQSKRGDCTKASQTFAELEADDIDFVIPEGYRQGCVPDDAQQPAKP